MPRSANHREALRLTGTSPLSYEDIRRRAALKGSEYGIYDELGRSDMDDFARKLGGTLNRDSGADMIGSLTVFGTGQFTILMPGMESARRARFRIARAIGWYFLLYEDLELTGFRFLDHDVHPDAVIEANVFAATLLMPTQQFTQAALEPGATDWSLSETFGVSPAAVVVRAEHLDLPIMPTRRGHLDRRA